MQGIERDGAAGELEFAEQPLRRGNFVGFLIDLDMCQHQARLKVEGMQHLGRRTAYVRDEADCRPMMFPVELRRNRGSALHGRE